MFKLRNGSFSKGFTLIELLVVISIIALLLSILLPSLGKVKEKVKAVVCSSQMRQWGLALSGYAADNGDKIPYFTLFHSSANPRGQLNKGWFDALAPYISAADDKGVAGSSVRSENYYLEIRECAASRKGNETYIGANFAWDRISAPFYYGHVGMQEYPQMLISRIRRPSSTLTFTDVGTAFVYNPFDTGYNTSFVVDYDGDGELDSCSFATFNGARPKVHSNGSNFCLIDGHVEQLRFSESWDVDGNGYPTHAFWKMKK